MASKCVVPVRAKASLTSGSIPSRWPSSSAAASGATDGSSRSNSRARLQDRISPQQSPQPEVGFGRACARSSAGRRR